MDFQNVNSLNVWLNLLTGNILPMIDHDAPISFFWKMYSVFVWIIEIAVTIMMVPGVMYVSMEKAINDSLICFVETIEMFFMIWRIYARKDLMHQLIQKLNEKLHSADETMKNIVTETINPIKFPLHFYWTTGMISIIVWHSVTFLVIFEKNQFYYEDYRVPAGFSKQPFSFKVFLFGGLFILLSMIYSFIKKVGAEVYTVHLILMITAQYRYIAQKIAMIFREENEDDEFQKGHFPTSDRKKETELRALCRHHNDVIYLMSLLKELLSLSFTVMYINNVLRFCFIGVLIGNIASVSLFEAMPIMIYTSGAIVQLYILCSCVQQLITASTEITDKAFYEKWYLLQPSIKHIFMLMIMANNLECKIAMFKNFNFSLPSFMAILNQSYSIALLFLKTQ